MAAQAHVESIARHAGMHAASVPPRLSAELSELLREVRGVTAYARRTALEAVHLAVRHRTGLNSAKSVAALYQQFRT